MTALHYAVKKDDFDIARYLIQQDYASLYVRDYKMRTPEDMNPKMT